MIDFNTLVGAIGAVAAAVAALVGALNRRKIKATDVKVAEIPPKLEDIHTLVNSQLDDVRALLQDSMKREAQLRDILENGGTKIVPPVIGSVEPLPPRSQE